MPHGDLPLFYTFQFYLFGLLAIGAAVAFVTRRSPVAAAMWLVVTMFNLAALYVMLDAQFIGIIQILVYAGAIMVVFLFVIMLLNLGHASEVSDIRGNAGKIFAGLIGVALLAMILAVTRWRVPDVLALPTDLPARQIEQTGVIAPVAQPLFNQYLLAFEVTSVLLLAAVVGAVVLGKQHGTTRGRATDVG
jgi:NADH-quinone oxidoreductase subunit J